MEITRSSLHLDGRLVVMWSIISYVMNMSFIRATKSILQLINSYTLNNYNHIV